MKGASKALEVFHPATSGLSRPNRLRPNGSIRPSRVWCEQCKCWWGRGSVHYQQAMGRS